MTSHMTFKISDSIQQDFKKTCNLAGTSMSNELRRFVADYITRQVAIFEQFEIQSSSINKYNNKSLNKATRRWEDSYE